MPTKENTFPRKSLALKNLPESLRDNSEESPPLSMIRNFGDTIDEMDFGENEQGNILEMSNLTDIPLF